MRYTSYSQAFGWWQYKSKVWFDFRWHFTATITYIFCMRPNVYFVIMQSIRNVYLVTKILVFVSQQKLCEICERFCMCNRVYRCIYLIRVWVCLQYTICIQMDRIMTNEYWLIHALRTLMLCLYLIFFPLQALATYICWISLVSHWCSQWLARSLLFRHTIVLAEIKLQSLICRTWCIDW